MKKLSILFTSSLILISLTACNSNQSTTSSTIQPTAKTVTTTPTSPKYEFVFHEGPKYKIVALGDMKIAYVDLAGNVIHYAYPFDNGPDEFVEGLARYVENNKVGFIDQDLKVIIPAKYDWASTFENGTAKICNGCKEISNGEYSQMKGGTWGTIDKKGIETWNK